LLINYFFF